VPASPPSHLPKFEKRGEAKRLASGIVFRARGKSAREVPRKGPQQRRPAELRRGVSELQIANQCFLVVEPIVVVPVVPDVVVAVVPEVDVAVVEVMAVPEVSVDVPAGMAEVDVPELVVSVAIVPVVDVSVAIVDAVSDEAAAVSVLLLLVSLLQAKPKTLSARTVTRTRSFLLICFFLSIKFFVGSRVGWKRVPAHPPWQSLEMVSAKRAASQPGIRNRISTLFVAQIGNVDASILRKDYRGRNKEG
jgi:hypothetical protein